MAKKARPRPERFTRTAQSSYVCAATSLRVDHPRGYPASAECKTYLELRGPLDEPIRGVRDVEVHLRAVDKVELSETKPLCIGIATDLSPVVSIGLISRSGSSTGCGRWPQLGG